MDEQAYMEESNEIVNILQCVEKTILNENIK